MNLMNRMISYDKNKNVEKEVCECEEFINSKTENQIVKYPPLSDEEIEQIIKERYDYKDKKTKTFIKRALKIHDNRYDYSNTIFIKMREKIEIICRVEGHKPFLQRADAHLQGQGCSMCGGNKKLTSNEVIKKFNEIHGEGTYDYSKVNYVNMHTDVIIICPKHGSFPQTPSNHLSGKGCLICAIEKRKCKLFLKLTNEEFIRQANEIFKGIYDYSKVNYINIDTEVIIICPKHGDFKQIPYNHLQGHGCQKCANEKIADKRRKPLWKFIEESNKIHGEGTYDYSKVNYINDKTNIIIICPKHGSFPQTPNNHLCGNGCPTCSESTGERKIRLFLENKNIKFEKEKQFNDCRNILPLPFDFYIPKYNLCIEYDGIQHFIPHDFNSKETEEQKMENLKMVQHRDNIKNNYCKNNNINLLRIRYDENVEEKLSEYFYNYKNT